MTAFEPAQGARRHGYGPLSIPFLSSTSALSSAKHIPFRKKP